MLQVKLLMGVIFTLFLKLELSLDRHCLRWVLMRCQLTDLLKVVSGTLMLFSNLNHIPQEICMILFSSKTQFLVITCQRNTAQLLKKLTKKVLKVLSVMVKVGPSKKQRRIFFVRTQLQYHLRCSISLRKKPKQVGNSSQ